MKMPWLAGVLFVAIGCAAMATNDRLVELHKQLDPGIGKATQEEIAHVWGPPDGRDTIGRSEYWTYRLDYGTRSKAVDTGDGFIVATSVHKEDRIVFEFIRGILVTWRADVKR